jgi:hypothetical protein
MPIATCNKCGETVRWTHRRGDRIKGLGHWDVSDSACCSGELILPPREKPEHPIIQCPREHRDYPERFKAGVRDAFETKGGGQPRRPAPIVLFSWDREYMARTRLAEAAYLEGYRRALAKLQGVEAHG